LTPLPPSSISSQSHGPFKSTRGIVVFPPMVFFVHIPHNCIAAL
jgi:hypothetical protein